MIQSTDCSECLHQAVCAKMDLEEKRHGTDQT